jgi:hypothetical protein
MMKRIGLVLVLALGSLLAAGCEPGGGDGNVDAVKKAAAERPTSIDQVQGEMPPQAKASAANAMGAAQGMQQHMQAQGDAQKAAMEKMKGGR